MSGQGGSVIEEVQERPGVEGPPPGLRKSVTGGVRWRLVGQATAQATSAGASIVLAHLLTPYQFGLAGMAMVFVGLGATFGDLALSAALIQRHDLREEDRSTAFWTNAAAGTLLMLVGIGISPLVADFFGQPSVAPLFAGASVLFLLWSLSSTQNALLVREMNFRGLEIRVIVAGFAGATAAVLLGVAGAGAWALDRPGGGAGRRLARASLDVLLLAAEAHVLEGKPARARLLQRQDARLPESGLPREQRRQPARRPLPRLRRARPLQRRLQHDVPSCQPHLPAPAAGSLLRLRQDPARAGAAQPRRGRAATR